MDLADLGAREAAAQIAAGTLTAEALAEALLARIAERDPAIEAWQYFDPDAVRAAARRYDTERPGGPLGGVPIGVKDILDTHDMPTGYGSALYAGHRPAWDAACVALARGAGAIVMGKTVSTEFAALAPGKTRNPHDVAHTPGGSSSGSAAAVAAGMVPLAIGTQTAGSVIRPAAFCGVVGYKPSYGLIERAGVKAASGSLDTIGVFARAVGDAALFAAVLADRPALAEVATPATLRVGLYRTSDWERADGATHAAIERAAARLAARGAAMVEIAATADHAALIAAQTAIMGWETAGALAFERLNRLDRLAPTTQTFLRNADTITLAAYDAARAEMPALRAAFDRLFGACDVLLTPAAPGEAPEGLASTGDSLFNRAWTALGTPCVTLPAGRGPHGLPLGVKLVGRRGDDARTLGAAAFVERALA
ncbi:MAG TPA: amidase [Hyphomicrobiales bacterium]|nr:amidase [Hyphomicrobiales bacterium]